MRAGWLSGLVPEPGRLPAPGFGTLEAMAFGGLRVISFESRRSAEMAELIRRQDGDAFAAPSMCEVPLEASGAIEFGERLFSGAYDMMILLTGVGTRALRRALAERYSEDRFAHALRGLTVIARGPKPAAVLREWRVPMAAIAPEPNTWREVLSVTAGRPERRIGVQEYGKPNPELLDGLEARGADVTPVRVYRWDLPEDTGPLREAARRIAGQEADIALFTSSAQIVHLIRVAHGDGIEAKLIAGLKRMIVASIGPTTTEALEEFGLRPDFEPSHPKMGFLTLELASQAGALVAAKRSQGGDAQG